METIPNEHTEEPKEPHATQPTDDRDERARKLNASARAVSARDFVREYLPERPNISKEFVPSANPFVLDDSKPHRIGGATADATSNGGAASAFPPDSKRNRFDPEKHLLGDDGKPVLTPGGRFKSIPAKDRERTIARQRAAINGLRSESEADEPEGKQVDAGECEEHAGLFVDFTECLFSLFRGPDVKMGHLPNGKSERDLIAGGIASAFQKWGLVRFPAILGLGLALYSYARRVFPRGQGDPENAKQAEGGEIIEINNGEPMPATDKAQGTGTAFDLNDLN